MTSLVPFAGRKKAPCVSQDAMVGAMMTSLISDLEKAYNGQECIHGLQEFLKHGSIPKNAIQNNRLLLKSLMAINYECIFKRSDIKAALVELDCKLQYKISNGYQCHGWADDWASFIHVCIMDVKKSFRNCKNFARVPAWLMELYDILKTSHKNMSPTERSTSQSSSCLGDQTTPCATKRRCLVYRKSQSPDKEEQEDEKTPDDSFHYDPTHDMAIKVSGVGKILQSKKYKQLPCGTRVYLFGDGSTWEINPHTGVHAPQDDQSRGECFETEGHPEDDEQGDGQGDEEVDDMGDEEGEEEEATPKQPKPTSAKGKGKGKGKKQVANKFQKTGKGKGKGRVLLTNVPKKHAKDCYKTKERHREHSRIWHQVFYKEKKKGCSDEAAKAIAGKAATAHCVKKFG